MEFGTKLKSQAFCIFILLMAPHLFGANITLPYSFVNGQVADADQINANFQALKNNILSITLGDNTTGNTLISANLTVGNYTLPKVDGVSGQVLVTDGAGNLSWQSPDAVSSDKTLSNLSDVAAARTNLGLGNMSLQNANAISMGNATISDNLTIGNYTFPKSDGTSGEHLVTNGAGRLTWLSANAVSSDRTLSNLSDLAMARAHLGLGSLASQSSESVTITGNIGIGTTTPEGPLDVEIVRIGPQTIDQQQTQYYAGWDLYNEWQSFTAGVSGFLTQLDVNNANAATTLTFTLNVYQGTGTGGSLLSSHVLTMSSGTGWKSLPINSNPPKLVSGQVYSLNITGGPRLGRSSTDVYAGGVASWSSAEDLMFMTYVSPQNITTGIMVDASGNVGLGTSSPTSKLHVVGLHVFPNNAAALSAGLTVGAFYRTGGDPDVVCVVH